MSDRAKREAAQLVGVAEIRAKIGVGRQVIQNWKQRYPDFPRPIAVLATGPIWKWGPVKAWAIKRGPSGRYAARLGERSKRTRERNHRSD